MVSSFAVLPQLTEAIGFFVGRERATEADDFIAGRDRHGRGRCRCDLRTAIAYQLVSER